MTALKEHHPVKQFKTALNEWLEAVTFKNCPETKKLEKIVFERGLKLFEVKNEN